MGRFSCRFPSRCFAATVVWVVSVVGFRVVVLRQPSYGSFQLSISESLFCGNCRMGRFSCRFPSRFFVETRMGRFSCRFPSRCFAATVVWVVSVVGFRVVVLNSSVFIHMVSAQVKIVPFSFTWCQHR